MEPSNVTEAKRLRVEESLGPARIQRRGRNINGYFGETIDLPAVLQDCFAAATTHGWALAQIPVHEQIILSALTRPGEIASSHESSSRPSTPRIYISTGIHGDEPAGPLAVLQLLRENQWPSGLGLWLCPCLNPTGFRLHRRENAEGLDLNRQYLQPQAAETAAHVRWLEQQPAFDLCLCLHEDWEAHGFYVYELNPDDRPSLAPAMLSSVARICPIDTSDLIEGRPAQNGIIRPAIDPRERPQWPEAFYLLSYKTRLSYTLEAPSDFPLENRVAALVEGVRAALSALGQRSEARPSRM